MSSKSSFQISLETIGYKPREYSHAPGKKCLCVHLDTDRAVFDLIANVFLIAPPLVQQNIASAVRSCKVTQVGHENYVAYFTEVDLVS